jgi:hypothetical protein
MEKGDPRKIPVLDLNQAAFQFLYGNEPELIMQGSRGAFFFVADDKFFDLSERYNGNEAVRCLDFVNAQRQLKSRLMAAKGRLPR